MKHKIKIMVLGPNRLKCFLKLNDTLLCDTNILIGIVRPGLLGETSLNGHC
jgi:hypothetical protein